MNSFDFMYIANEYAMLNFIKPCVTELTWDKDYFEIRLFKWYDYGQYFKAVTL